jgi:hypothetical protein
MKKLLITSVLAFASLAVLAPTMASAESYHRSHRVCHMERQHHRVCHWVR